MDLPPANHKIWGDIITGKVKFDFECLALQILLGRLQVQVSNERLSTYAGAIMLRNFFEKNWNLPSAQKDLLKILR